MRTVTMHAAKTTLSKLVAAVEAGEEIVIMRGRAPVARLVAFEEPRVRTFGALEGAVSVSRDFFEALPEEELDAWDR
jgi:antitoxin (DNA-binding transcriptional repressor) of toxin-antitoxin stability system